MLDLIGLVFTLFKALMQASIYATLIFLLARLWARFAPKSGLAQASSNGKRFWWRGGLIAATGLFLVAITPWGNHGLGGDYARIPLSHGLAMEELNGYLAYFEPFSITRQSDIITGVVSYQVSNDVLCAKTDGDQYFTYDLSTGRSQTFVDSAAYNKAAKNLGLPATSQFEPFNMHYKRYWEGWRFWLLA